MKVLKFGGTSVGSAEAMLRVRQIVESTQGEAIVVVSALSGITDQLLHTAMLAAQGDDAYERELGEIVARHKEAMAGAVTPNMHESVENQVVAMIGELTNILRGVFLIKDLPTRTCDAILSYGERLSAAIMSGVLVESRLYDAREMIKTRDYFGRHMVDLKLTQELIHKQLDARPKLVLVPGFIASNAAGETTHLGRGGSDYTAALLAATLGASELEIWTDVDGFMTADPGLIPNAYVIEYLSFVEAMELCNFGARVIYPPTIFPVYHQNIPIRIRNTFNPAAPGTLISKEADNQSDARPIKGISSVSDTCLITMRGLGMVGVIGVNRRIFKALSKAGISVFFVSQAASENTTSIGVRQGDAEMAQRALSEEFTTEIDLGEINPIATETGLATIAIVGEGMRGTPGIAGKLFGTLGRNGINVIACAQGSSQTNISLVIASESLPKAIGVIHDSFFLSDRQVLNIFIAGVGLVGGNLLEQIRLQQQTLLKTLALEVRVVGITNSRKFVVDPAGIDLSRWRTLLDASTSESTPERFAAQIERMNLFNSVFVDCTANEQVASLYKRLLEDNVSVVTANKIAASSRYELYEELKNSARNRGVKFLFETNVGAGLPVIGTINSLVNSGDRILKIEAVLSGTLNFIFNEMSAQVPMSQAIRMAMQAGYAEPDPRIDLSGMDVVRKLVILAREAGYPLEQQQVGKELFIPSDYFEGSVDDFWKRIPQIDAQFETQRQRLDSQEKRWRFVATLDEGKASVALREVDSASPFYQLEGSNNVILLTTERYKQYPMQIKGYGAGEAVTAAGVFADIISIANIR